MKNPIRAYIARIVREEVNVMRQDANLRAIQKEIDNATLAAFYKRPTEPGDERHD